MPDRTLDCEIRHKYTVITIRNNTRPYRAQFIALSQISVTTINHDKFWTNSVSLTEDQTSFLNIKYLTSWNRVSLINSEQVKRSVMLVSTSNLLKPSKHTVCRNINPLKPELNPICYLLALLGAHHFLHVSMIRVKSLTFRLLMSYIYGAPILDVSRSHTTTQHSR